jgi:hypothetical protein
VDPALTSLAPSFGPAGVLLVVVIYLLRVNSQDRKQYRDDVADIQAQNLENVQNLNAEHARQLGRVEDSLKSLRESNQKVLQELEDERRRRFAAEEAAHLARQRLLAIEGGRRDGDQ